jgi:hypothetical protein
MYISDADEFKEQHKVSIIITTDKRVMIALNKDLKILHVPSLAGT